MDISVITALLLTISCCLWTTEGRKYVRAISVTNGGPWGSWGKAEFCPEGYAVGFSLKVHSPNTKLDDTALNGIHLNCSDGTLIKSLEHRWGTWSAFQSCPSGYLVSFSLRVERPLGRGDDTAANNLQFSCSDGSKLMGSGKNWGVFGKWSLPCPYRSSICGIQTKVELEEGWFFDNTALNDVKFFCCR